MPKILLVEDDNSLREIFSIHLQAEGYAILVAADGEEGLAMAIKEKPDLIIADIMMPKLSGFEMIESLRAATDLKDTKVVMMTALGQAEDQARGEKLGVVKYLVKSQVTLDDLTRVVKEILGPADAADSGPAQGTADKSNNKPESEKSMQDNPAPTNPAPAEPPAEPSVPADSAAPASQPTASEEQAQVQDQVNSFVSSAPAADSSAPSSDAGADVNPPVPPASSEPPAEPTQPPASTGPADSSAPSDPTSNAL